MACQDQLQIVTALVLALLLALVAHVAMPRGLLKEGMAASPEAIKLTQVARDALERSAPYSEYRRRAAQAGFEADPAMYYRLSALHRLGHLSPLRVDELL